MDAYTASDTLICEDYKGEWVLSDLADGNVAELSAPNELSATTTGYNGNSLSSHNEPGRQRECTLRLVKGSGDDKRFNQNYNLWKNRDIRFKPFKMSFTKNIGHGDGSITRDTVDCFAGFPAGQPTQMTDTSGNTEQVVSIYMIRFGNSERSM
nr:MAG TPA: hypothetical protein [Caudoviricetes sp.]